MPKVKRLNKIIHPNSRKAVQLASKEHRKQRTMRSKDETKNKKEILIRKLTWFRDQIRPAEDMSEDLDPTFQQFKTKNVFSVDEIKSLIDLYFRRFDDELDQINTKNSIGNRAIGQNFSREKAIEITLSNEMDEYTTNGLVVPDLTVAKNVALLRNWNGQSNILPAIKLKSIKK